MKKLFALVLALIMLSASFTALAEDQQEIVTLTVAGGNDIADAVWNESYYVQEIEKRLGIRLECTSYMSDAWETQKTLLFASNNLPDILIKMNLSIDTLKDYGMQGYLLPINEYLDQMPNLKAYFEQYPLYEKICAADDGNVYTLTQLTSNPIAQTQRVFMNKNWLEAVGMEAPTTLDALYDVLKAFKEQDANQNGDANDELPLGKDVSSVLMPAFGINATDYKYALQQKDGVVYLANTTEAFKNLLAYMNKLYTEGLLDAECFIQSGDEAKAKVADNRVGMFTCAAPYVEASQDIAYDMNFIWTGAYSSEYQPERTIVLSNEAGANPMVAVKAETKYPEAAARLIDYCYTDEGHIAGRYGFEGITYNPIVPDVPGLEECSYPLMMQPEGYASGEQFRYTKALINGGFNILSLAKGTSYGVILEANDEQLEALLPTNGWSVLLTRAALNDPSVQRVYAFPTLLYTENENLELTTLKTDISTYVENMYAQFITGKIDLETGWDEYVNTLNRMGAERAIAIEQAAYDRLMK